MLVPRTNEEEHNRLNKVSKLVQQPDLFANQPDYFVNFQSNKMVSKERNESGCNRSPLAEQLLNTSNSSSIINEFSTTQTVHSTQETNEQNNSKLVMTQARDFGKHLNDTTKVQHHQIQTNCERCCETSELINVMSIMKRATPSYHKSPTDSIQIRYSASYQLEKRPKFSSAIVVSSCYLLLAVASLSHCAPAQKSFSELTPVEDKKMLINKHDNKQASSVITSVSTKPLIATNHETKQLKYQQSKLLNERLDANTQRALFNSFEQSKQHESQHEVDKTNGDFVSDASNVGADDDETILLVLTAETSPSSLR